MPSAPLRRATYVTSPSRVTLCVTTATLQENIEGKPITPATSLRLNPKTTQIPVVFHNLRGYDSHLLMQAISKVEGGISCIPNNTEKYISFSLGQLRFIDSAQFLLASLDKLVAANPPEDFRITAQHEPNRERRELLMRKGVYPYEYMDTWDRFTEPKLPPKEVFYSKLSDAHISDEDYTHAQKIWRPLGARPWGTTATCTAAPTSCCSLTCSRPFGGPAKSSTAWTLLHLPGPFVGRLTQEDRR